MLRPDRLPHSVRRTLAVVVLGAVALGAGASTAPDAEPRRPAPVTRPIATRPAAALTPEDRRRMGEEAARALDESRSLYRKGDLAGAVQAAEAALRLDLQASRAIPNPFAAELLPWLGQLQAESGDLASARNAWSSAVRVVAKVYGENSPLVTEFKWGVSDIDRLEKMSIADRRAFFDAERTDAEVARLRDAKKYEDALVRARRGLDTNRRLLGTAHPKYAQSLYLVAAVLSFMDEVDEADRLNGEAAAIWRNTFGEQSSSYSKALTGVATLRDAAASRALTVLDYDSAVRKSREALTAWQAVPGVPPWVITDKREAVRFAERMKAMTPDKLRQYRRGEDLDASAARLARQGFTEEAVQSAEQSAEAFRQSLGEQDPQYWRELEYLASLKERADPEAADAVWARWLRLQLATLGANDPGYLAALARDKERLAERARRLDEVDQAIQYLEEAGALWRRQAEVFRKGGRNVDDRSERSAQRRITYLRRVARLTPELREVLREADRHDDSAADLTDENNYRGALAERKLALEARERIREEARDPAGVDAATAEADRRIDADLVAGVIQDVAFLYDELGDPRKSADHYRKAADLKAAAYGAEAPETNAVRSRVAEALLGVANMLKEQGEPQRALETAEEALDIQLAAFDESHPKVLDTKRAIAANKRVLALPQADQDRLKESARLEELARQQVRVDNPAAIRSLTAALDLRRQVYGEEDLRYGRMLGDLADVYAQSAQFQQAADARRKSAQILLNLSGPDGAEYLDAVRGLLTSLDALDGQLAGRTDWSAVVPLRRELLAAVTVLYGDASPQATSRRLSLEYATRMAALTPAQKEKLAEVARLRDEARGLAWDKETLPQAIDLVRRSVSMAWEVLPDDRGYADDMDRLAGMYRRAGDDRRAAECERMALDQRTRLLGQRHPETVAGRLARLYWERNAALDRNDFDAARKSGRTILEMRLRAVGRNHWRFLEDRYFLSRIDVVASFKEPDRAALSETNAGMAEAERLAGEGRMAEAVAAADRVRAVRERLMGNDSLTYADGVELYGRLCGWAGDYARAEPAMQEAARLYRLWLGTESPDYANALDSLGRIHANLGNTRDGLDYLAEAIERRTELTRADPLVWQDEWVAFDTLDGIAIALTVLLDDAERKKELAPDARAAMVRTLTNLADQLDLVTDDDGRLTSTRITFVTLRGRAHLIAGETEQAEAQFLKARDLTVKARGRKGRAYLECLVDLTLLYRKRGEYEKVREVCSAALEVVRTDPTVDPASAAGFHTALAWVEQAAGRTDAAVAELVLAMDLGQKEMRRVLDSAAETTTASYVEDVASQLETLLCIAAWAPHGQPQPHATAPSISATTRPTARTPAEEALTWTLRRKAALLSAAFYAREGLAAASQDPELASRMQRLRALRGRIAAMANQPPRGMPADAIERVVRDLRAESDRIQIELNTALAARRPAPPDDVTPEQVRRTLPAGAALVEFVRARTANFRATGQQPKWGPAHYFALVLSSDTSRPVRLFDLGEAAAIDAAVANVRAAVSGFNYKTDDERVREAEFRDAAKALYGMLFKPEVLAAIGPAKSIYLAPDGELNRVPFEALTSGLPGSGYLIEEGYRFVYVASGQDLLRPKAELGKGTIVFADPDYDLAGPERAELAKKLIDPKGEQQAVALRGVHPGDRGGRAFPRLKETFEEACDVEACLTGSVYGPVTKRIQKEALRGLFLSVRSPRVLHVATHGYFDPDPVEQRTAGGGSRAGGAPAVTSAASMAGASGPSGPSRGGGGRSFWVLANNPLLRCGLALAGASAPPQQPPALGGPTTQPADDGLVTAEEVSLMDLRGTDLVVLSACETGLGDVKTGRGVYGLRWAFLTAGARTLVTSLFKVPDSATRELMGNFYESLKDGKTKLESLHEARLAVIRDRRKQGGGAHPFFWASFILVGDPE